MKTFKIYNYAILEDAIDRAVSDICDTEPANVDHLDTVCINVNKLLTILRHNILGEDK